MIASIVSRMRKNLFLRQFFGDVAVMNRLVQENISTMQLHQNTFGPFKAKHSGQDIVLMATGPSLKDYVPIANSVTIGVNQAFRRSGVELDYLFAQDYEAVSKVMPDMNNYRKGRCVKFYGYTTDWTSLERNHVIPESDAIDADALRYRTDRNRVLPYEWEFAYDLVSQPLACCGTIVFPAMQFALWTNPRRIYLVGCDCSNLGHFEKNDSSLGNVDLRGLVRPWRELKKFAEIYYPKTEIISVNPVGLKGLFKDLYQEGK